MLDRLMRGPILADTDGVVRVDPYAGDLHDGREADGRLHVVAEDHEGGAEGAQARDGHAIANGAHGVLADAEVEVPAAVVAPARHGRHEVVRAWELQRGEAGGAQVGGAAQHPRHALGDVVQADGARLTRGHALGVRCELLAVLGPVVRQLASLDEVELRRFLGVLRPVLLHELLPGLPALAAPGCHLAAEVLQHRLRHEELLVRPAVDPLGGGHLRLAERSAVGAERVLLGGCAPSDVGVHDDQRRPLLFPLEDLQRACERVHVVGVANAQHVPAVRDEAGGHILGNRPSGVALDGDLVVVPDPDEIVKPQVSCERGSLMGHALLQVAIAGNYVHVVVEHLKALLVVRRSIPLGGNGHANAVRHALPERPSRGLNAGGPTILRVAWTPGLVLPELLQVVQGDGELIGAGHLLRHDVPNAGQVDEAVDEGGRVAARQHEAVTVHPLRIDRVVLEDARPEGVRHGRQCHRRARVAGVRLLHAVHGDAAEAVDDHVVLLRGLLVHEFSVLGLMEQQVEVHILVRFHGRAGHVARYPMCARN
mmetsp:Transcript_45337/g.61501  ORF Transcript_45337/g.61501 Transcript_45337/m.61501 type:complete len:539 (+) Transcript_45337:182-1798(+)